MSDLLENCKSQDKSVRHRSLRAAFFKETGKTSANHSVEYLAFVAGVNFALQKDQQADKGVGK